MRLNHVTKVYVQHLPEWQWWIDNYKAIVPRYPDVPMLILKAYGDNDCAEKYITIEESPFVVGRYADSDWQINRDSVSGYHATFIWEGGNWWLEDNKSTNGTFINSTRTLEKTSLYIGDVIHFASTGYKRVLPFSEDIKLRWNAF